METYALTAQKRATTGKQVSALRGKGIIPACVYGGGSENRNLQLELGVFEKLYRNAGDSSLIDLAVDSETPVKVLVHDVQYDPIYDRITHVDFRQVNMKEKLETDIEVRLIGESPAVKGLGAILVQNKDTVGVRCLPGDLVNHIDIDVSSLKQFDDSIRVKDVVPPPGIEFTDDPEDSIAYAEEPISEEELAKLNEAVVEDVTAVKVEGEEKKAAEAAAAAEAGEEKAE